MEVEKISIHGNGIVTHCLEKVIEIEKRKYTFLWKLCFNLRIRTCLCYLSDYFGNIAFKVVTFISNQFSD